jgi:hypothetical protein
MPPAGQPARSTCGTCLPLRINPLPCAAGWFLISPFLAVRPWPSHRFAGCDDRAADSALDCLDEFAWRHQLHEDRVVVQPCRPLVACPLGLVRYRSYRREAGRRTPWPACLPGAPDRSPDAAAVSRQLDAQRSSLPMQRSIAATSSSGRIGFIHTS